MIVRVVPDVTGLDKRFDYRVPDSLADRIEVGAVVRANLHGRRIGGWVIDIDPADGFVGGELTEITKVTGLGPSRELIDLAEWAATRWVGRIRHFLHAGTPPRAVAARPASRRAAGTLEPRSPATSGLLDKAPVVAEAGREPGRLDSMAQGESAAGGVVVLPPAVDPMPVIASALAKGPTLVIEPSVDRAALLAARLRRSGVSVALMPRDWAQAAGGVDVVIGPRGAAWAPCPDLAVAVVLNEHDEALQAEGSPTWHARDVIIERCRRVGASVVLVSPVPTVTALTWAEGSGGVRRPSIERTARGWPRVEIVDRSDVEPWKRSLLSSELIEELRDPDRTVVCVSNTTGRAKLLACRTCRSIARCEVCDAAVALGDDDRLECPRCGTQRPPVCLVCHQGTFAKVRPGVNTIVEEVAAAAGRSAVLVDGRQPDPPVASGVYVGTEAVLHRVDRADTVAFLEFDRELLAPRYRATEQAVGLLARAAAVTGARAGGGKLLVQTFLADDPIVRAVAALDFEAISENERRRRETLDLPPFAAFAEISGPGAAAFVSTLPTTTDVVLVDDGDGFAARARDWMTLGRVLGAGERPTRQRLRIAVDPPR